MRFAHLRVKKNCLINYFPVCPTSGDVKLSIRQNGGNSHEDRSMGSSCGRVCVSFCRTGLRSPVADPHFRPALTRLCVCPLTLCGCNTLTALHLNTIPLTKWSSAGSKHTHAHTTHLSALTFELCNDGWSALTSNTWIPWCVSVCVCV